MNRRRNMPESTQQEQWKIWVDVDRRVVSFHEEAGCRMIEFESWELFMHCVDQYTSRQFRYQ